MDFIYIIIGFFILIKGADVLINSSSKLAKMLGVPSFIIGLSIVAFGTSAPEAAVGIFSGIKHVNQITLGDVIGSDIVNIALIIGLTSVILPIIVDKGVVLKDIILSLVVQIILCCMIFFGSDISRAEGVILLGMFGLFIFYIARKSKLMKEEIDEIEKLEEKRDIDVINLTGKKKIIEISKQIFLILLGLVGLILGGNLIVESATSIAKGFGVSETLIGLTVVAIGTSLPELVTCVVAALKGEMDIAVGNIIGSNIFNILFVLGLSSTINPIVTSMDVYIDLSIMVGATIILYLISAYKGKISKLTGSLFITYYIVYIAYKIFTLK